uniref:RNase H type-1 domain-containing protein n=1 Tax=Fagus sylvatica TaxID=28930 RepID=A0A2N9FQL4_FAGSY
MEAEESAATSSSLVPAAVRTLQKSPKFKSLFNQLGFGPEARNTATEALITIAAESGATCFTAEAHASRAFLETTNWMKIWRFNTRNAIDAHFTDEDLCCNVSQQKIQGSPMEVTAEYTMGHGRLNGKPIRIAANSCPFDQTEAHFVEAALYDDLASTGRTIHWSCLNERRKGRNVKLNMGVHHNACVSSSPMDALSIAYKGAWGLIAHSKRSTLMSSKEVTVDHAQSTIMNPQEVVVDQTKSTAMSSEEAMVNQTESTTTRKEKSTTAEPNMTSKEELEMCLLGDYDEMSGDRPGVSGSFFECGARYQTCASTVAVKHRAGQKEEWAESGVVLIFEILIKHVPKDEFPLPNMDLLIDSAAGHAMFSFMDGFSGYNQIRMSTKDAEKTAFRTPIGNFYYTVMPFGLKNVGATYQRTMTAMFHDMMHKEIEDYVDDIVVKSKKREDHLGILKKSVHNRGIDVDPAKASAIATMKAPTSHKELKSFLGRLSYIRRFIPELAQWLLQLSQYEIITETPTAIKSQAITDLLAQFPGEDSSSISHEVPGGNGRSSVGRSKYEAYITGLAIAHEMGIKHLRVIGDSNLIICQTKGEFSLKEPSLALYRALAQKLEEKFDTFEISHAMRCENRYADALATLGSQVSFEGSKTWRTPIKAKLMSPEGVADLKVLKDYVLIAGDLYRRLPGGVLARCVNLQEAAKKLIEVHEKCCEFRDGQEWQTWKVWKKQESWLQVRSLRYHQKLADAYEKTLQTRIFAKGQMVLRTVDHVRRGLPSPSKFAPNWEGTILDP